MPERLQQKRWRIDIAGWYALSGLGNSIFELKANLLDTFQHWQDRGDPLPRPGRNKKDQIAFASNGRIEKHSDLLRQFTFDVLNLPWAWISDESSLWDFHTDTDNKKLQQKIYEVFGTDVADIESGNIADILDRIYAQKHTGLR